MEKYIIIALILLFGLVYYFDNKQDNKVADLEKSSTLELDKNKSKGKSFWKIFVDHNKSKNYYKGRGITVKSSNKPDSDTSACVGVTKSDKDMIITKFAGYVLQYPCTVNQSGEYHIEYNPDGTILSQRYRLDISVILGQKNGSFWWDGKSLNKNDTQGFRVQLVSNGNPVSLEYLKDRIKKSTFVKHIKDKNYSVYKDRNYVFTILDEKSKYIDDNPSISCDRYGNFEPQELFSPFHNVTWKKSECTIIWKYLNYIKIIVFSKPKYAYKYLEIYKQINNALQQTIIEKPNNPLKPKEK